MDGEGMRNVKALREKRALSMCWKRGKDVQFDKTKAGCVRIRMEEMGQRERESKRDSSHFFSAFSTGILTWYRQTRAFRSSLNLDKKSILYVFSLTITESQHFI